MSKFNGHVTEVVTFNGERMVMSTEAASFIEGE